MAEVKICTKCGAENAPDKKFCKKCGAPLQAAISSTSETEPNNTSAYNEKVTADSLVKRARIFIEDKNWKLAREYAESALGIDAEYAEAYFVKFMAEYKIDNEEKIPDMCYEIIARTGSLLESTFYSKAFQFGDEELKNKLTEYNKQAIYNYAVYKMEHVLPQYDVDGQYREVSRIFKTISDFKNSEQLAQECIDRAEKHKEREKERFENKQKSEYLDAVALMNKARSGEDYVTAMLKFKDIINYSDARDKYYICQSNIYDIALKLWNDLEDPDDIEKALYLLNQIPKYKDSQEQIRSINDNRYKLFLKANDNRVKQFFSDNKIFFAIGACILILIVLMIIFLPDAIREKHYSQAVECMKNKQYRDAEYFLSELQDYKDSNELLNEVRYNMALEMIENDNISGARDILKSLDYKDSKELLAKIDPYSKTGGPGTSKLTDIVGECYGHIPDIYVNITLADVPYYERSYILECLEYDVNMCNALQGKSNYFFTSDNFVGYGDEYGETRYYGVGEDTDEIYNIARNLCFTEDLISDDTLKAKISSNFTTVNGKTVWIDGGPNPSVVYYYDDAGIVSYSDTSATVWISSLDIGESFYACIFEMERDDISSHWKVSDSKMLDIRTYEGEIDIVDNNWFF